MDFTEAIPDQIDVVVVGSGAGGMTAALAARAQQLNVVIIEKAATFGGSMALSGGGIWAPGAQAMIREGSRRSDEEVMDYLKEITNGEVDEARLRAYVSTVPDVLDFLEDCSEQLRFVWRPGYSDYYPEATGGSSVGRTVIGAPIDLRTLKGDEARLTRPVGLAPNGIWIGPRELRDFYTLRQSWRGKLVLLKLVGRMVRARLLGERIAVIGQSLSARLMLAVREHGIPVLFNCGLDRLVTDSDGRVTGVVVLRDGEQRTVRATRGVVLATGGFEHNAELRKQHQPFLPTNWSLGFAGSTGDGLAAAQAVGADTALMDEAWWMPVIDWQDGRLQFLINERMIPGQFIVNGRAERYVNEAAPYMEFVHEMFAGEATEVPHIPSWMILDSRSWNKYVIAGHLPLPKIPGAPVPTGRAVPERWIESGQVKVAPTLASLAEQIGVSEIRLQQTADRFNRFARRGVDEDFHRGDNKYNNYYGDEKLVNPNLREVTKPPFYAFRLVPGDLGTSGGLVTDAQARVLDEGGKVIVGLYATGNVTASVMGRSYAGPGATIGPAMTFGYIAATTIARGDQQL